MNNQIGLKEYIAGDEDKGEDACCQQIEGTCIYLIQIFIHWITSFIPVFSIISFSLEVLQPQECVFAGKWAIES